MLDYPSFVTVRKGTHQTTIRARLLHLAVALLWCCVPTAQALRSPTLLPSLGWSQPGQQLKEESAPFQKAPLFGEVGLTLENGPVTAESRTRSLGPFGRLTGKWGPMADASAMQFSSMPVHRQSGLSMYPFRASDPSLQRWLSRDPIGESGGINLYGFVGNYPANYVDPYGESWFGDLLYQAGQGIYDLMMGDRPGSYDPNMKGSIEAAMGMGIDRNDNVLRDSIGQGFATLGEVGKAAAESYLGGKLAEAGLGVAAAGVCKVKPLLRAAKSRTKWGPEHGMGNVAHNNAIEGVLDAAESRGATNLRKSRVQRDAAGNRVRAADGSTRPDAAWIENGVRHNHNRVSDLDYLDRELDAFRKMIEADPNAINSLEF